MKIDTRMTPLKEKDNLNNRVAKNESKEDKEMKDHDDRKGCDCPTKSDRDEKRQADKSSVTFPKVLGGSFQYTDKLARKG